MKSIEKVEVNEKFITFHSLEETRTYKLSTYEKHIKDYAFKHVCDNCNFEDWSLGIIISTLDEKYLLKSFNELFTTQNEGLVFFEGKSVLKSKKMPVINEIGEYKNSRKEYQYSVQLLEFENGIKGRYFLNRSAKNINPTEGVMYEMTFKVTYGAYSSKLGDFVQYMNITLKQPKKANKKQLIHA